jgi:hypothetical protein
MTPGGEQETVFDAILHHPLFMRIFVDEELAQWFVKFLDQIGVDPLENVTS